MNQKNTVIRQVHFPVLLTLVSLLFTGCFHPEGENFVPVSTPEFENIEINLAQADDELYLFRPTRLSYRIEQGDFQVIKIEASLNGQSLVNQNDPTVIQIDPKLFPQGTHTLQLAATFASYSNTLASAVQKETKTITREFRVRIDLTSPQPVAIKEMKPRDGSLFVSWAKPEKSNFLHFQVHRFIRQSDKWVEEYRTEPWVVSPYKTEFNDSLYGGGDIQYRIDLIGYNYSTPGVLASTSFETVHAEISQVNENQVRISWPPSPFYKNINRLRFSTYNETDQFFDASQPVSLLRNVSLGYKNIHLVVPQMKYGNAYFNQLMSSFSGRELSITDDPDPIAVYYRYGAQELLARNGFNTPAFTLINSSTGRVEKSIPLASYYANASLAWAAEHSLFGMAPDGKSIYLFTGAEVVEFDEHLQFVQQYTMPDQPTDTYFFASQIKFSNNQIGCFYLYVDGIRLVNFKTNTVLVKGLSAAVPNALSADGKYFSHDHTLYEIGSTAINAVATFGGSRLVRGVRFSNNSDQLFISYSDGHFEVLDVTSKAIVSQHDFNAPMNGTILQDPVTGLIGVTLTVPSSNLLDLVIFDSSFSISKTIRVATECMLYNNTIYTSSRFSYPL
ncbi:MAG: hypothetical protein DI538_17070 [Azospira oryzae]|nr:MAG: hypothetical protein DI538_17070 [Azospira oryzae]